MNGQFMVSRSNRGLLNKGLQAAEQFYRLGEPHLKIPGMYQTASKTRLFPPVTRSVPGTGVLLCLLPLSLLRPLAH